MATVKSESRPGREEEHPTMYRGTDVSVPLLPLSRLLVFVVHPDLELRLICGTVGSHFQHYLFSKELQKTCLRKAKARCPSSSELLKLY